ncbi:heterodisulfide reductase-related iron-sulfur binding cluster [Aeromicrobium sp.]|uniref:(Fe-S)-binding protein n=1 Tax=Aeromicrobium sp. TaxID=1871063 RepID=UPI003C3263E7
MTLVLILGLVMNAIALPIAAKRIVFLYRLITSGQPAPDRVENVRGRVGETVKAQVVEVLGQKKLLKWSVPGAAHFFVFWAFLILASVYLEAYGSLFHEGFAIPLIGHWDLLGFAQDFIAVMAVVGLVVFSSIRLRQAPAKLGRKSRFSGSHLGGAWLVLLMIFFVVLSMFLFRGAGANTGNLPYGDGAFASHAAGKLLSGLSEDANQVVEHVGLLAHIGVMLVFLIIVLNSKHLHIFVAPLNVMFGRRPVALGAIKPMTVRGKPVDMEAMEELEEEDFEKLGIGKIEDFSWKGMLDFASCTECGRCQSQCPAWNTEKPLSPKLLIMGLRDHAFAKAPYLLADSDDERSNLSAEVIAEAERALVGETEGDAWHPSGGAVIDPDVLWSCVSCGACVEQCPVDIEHVDHIMDMRRHQVLVESNFPTELNNIFKGLERKGNPWGMDPKGRMDWAKNLDFPVKQVGVDIESLDEVEWLFWVGCAGAFEDRAKKTTQAVAELLNMAGVDFAVLGDGETCTGDPARRAGNEIVFMQLAMENAEVFKETKVKKVVSTCAHCFNSLKNEYSEFGVELEVVHHTQLLNRLVQEKRLTPVAPTTGAVDGKTITYHDPCFLGRHNKVYAPPRELLEVIPGATFTEMPRNSERSFCCGGGGARMWMEETIGSRINTNRTEEAVATGADQIAVGCPFCRVMLTDGLTAQQAEGKAREEVEVLDVAQMLLASVKRAPDPKVTEAEPDAEDRSDPDSISSTAAAAPAADAAASGEAEEKAPDELDEPAAESPEADQEVAAKHNVALDDEGGGHETSKADSTDEPAAGEDVPAVEEVPEPDPEPEPGDATEADDESVPEESAPKESGDEPEIPAKPDEGDDQSPAEEVTNVPDEAEPVEEESREEEEEAGTITPVEDVTDETSVEDAVPFSDPQPTSSDVSESATKLGSDDEDETPTT